MTREQKKLNELIISIETGDLQDILIFVSTISQEGKLKSLKFHLESIYLNKI